MRPNDPSQRFAAMEALENRRLLSVGFEPGAVALPTAQASPAIALHHRAKTTASKTSMTVSRSRSVLGQSITLTATVRPTHGAALPTGAVRFLDGNRVIGTASLDATG